MSVSWWLVPWIASGAAAYTTCCYLQPRKSEANTQSTIVVKCVLVASCGVFVVSSLKMLQHAYGWTFFIKKIPKVNSEVPAIIYVRGKPAYISVPGGIMFYL